MAPNKILLRHPYEPLRNFRTVPKRKNLFKSVQITTSNPTIAIFLETVNYFRTVSWKQISLHLKLEQI